MYPFHLAFPVKDLEATRRFFVDLLDAEVGRESKLWIDFNLFGHQISAHLRPDECAEVNRNPVDGDKVPVKHFGVVLPWDKWEAMADRMKAAEVEFIIEPKIRFKGKVGEQGTFFVLDPSGNALEFKTFKDMDNLFAPGTPE